MPNTELRYTIATAVVILLVCSPLAFAVPQPPAIAAPSNVSLVNLAEVSVQVFITPPDDTKAPHLARLLRTSELLESSIQTKIELEIRRSTNLRIVPTALPKLTATISVKDLGGTNSSVLAYYCITTLSLWEPARIARNGELTLVTSWAANARHSWGGDDSVITDLSSRLDTLLNEFLNEYLAANPKR